MATISPDLLKQIPLFALLDDEELAALAPQLREVPLLAGQKVFSEGDEGGAMYVVQKGGVELYLQDKAGDVVILGQRTVGELFGELSLLDSEKRSASAKAIVNTTLYEVDRHDLRMLIAGHPDAGLDMMATMGKRIRDADALVGSRVSRNVNDEMPIPDSWGDRLADRLTSLSGDIRFVYFSFVWFGLWIIVNLGIIPGVKPFDPFPFGLLTMVVSLEAIFLSLFVLMSQNRQTIREKVRNDIEYEVNIKAEIEVRSLIQQVEDLQQTMLQHIAEIKNGK